MQTESITLKLNINTEVLGAFVSQLRHMTTLLERITMKQTELAGELAKTTEEVRKIGTEVRGLLDKIDALQTAVDNAQNVDPAVLAALQDLQSAASTVDDLVPDAPASDTAPQSDTTPTSDTMPQSDSTPPQTDTGSVGVQPTQV